MRLSPNSLKRTLQTFAPIAMLFASCGGVKFSSVSPNLTLPPAYTSRSVYESGVAAYDFQDLVGNVLVISADSTMQPLRVAVVRPSSIKDSVAVRILKENESLNYYHSVVTKGGAVQGNYLAFAAKFTQDQIADYTLMDIAQASILFTQTSFTEVVNGLKNFVKEHPKPSNGAKRIWIKSAVLSASLYTAGNKISTDASGVVGNTFGVNGSVYNTNNQTIKGTIIGFDYFDVDELVGPSTRGLEEIVKIIQTATQQPIKLIGMQK